MTTHPLKGIMLLEAEVNPLKQAQFEERYRGATNDVVCPGKLVEYQSQPNKWGSELRIYSNNSDIAAYFQDNGFYVESHTHGYKSGEFKYRINNNNLWWDLVET